MLSFEDVATPRPETLHMLHFENSGLKLHRTLKSLSYGEVCLLVAFVGDIPVWHVSFSSQCVVYILSGNM